MTPRKQRSELPTPQQQSAWARNAARKSPWSRGPAVNTKRARDEFAKRARKSG